MFKSQRKPSWIRISTKEVPAQPAPQRCRCSNTAKASNELQIPCRCKEYEDTGELIGEGATSNVRLLRSRKTGSVYACKQFKNFSTKKQSFATNVLAEFYVSHGLRHPSIIQTHELCTVDGVLTMVMDYAPQNLLELSVAGAIPVDAAEKYLKQIVAGIGYIHNTGFAHRDIKLENVLLKGDQIKIIDFGTICTGKWMPTAVVGSVPFMGPELFTASHYSPQLADVWSIGILYACMILRRFPWASPTNKHPVYQVYANAVQGGDASPWPMTEFPPHLRTVLSIMLNPNPRQRPMVQGIPALLREEQSKR